MNAATQRRLTPLAAAVVVVLGGVLLAMFSGWGRGVEWDAPRPTPPLVTGHALKAMQAPPLQSYAQSWEQPLFSSDRKPMASSGGQAGASLADLTLTGVILTPQLHIALLGPVHPSKDDADNQHVNVREGALLPGTNWKLVQVLPRSAIFVSGGGRTELKLPAGAPIDAPPSAPTPPGEMQVNAPPPPAAPAPPQQHMPAMNPADTQNERLQRLRNAIIRQRAQQAQQNAQGEH